MSHNSTPAGRRRASITEFLLAQQSSPQPDDDAVEVIHAADLEAAGYMLGEQLGEGRFSKVHLGTHVASGAEHAVKVVDRSSLDEDDEAVEALQVEVAALTAARHENVVRLHAVVHTSEAVYLLMELLAGGELFDRIVEKGRYGEGEARGLVRQLLAAVESCHARGIVHRDLKPENMLFAGAEDAAAGPTLKLIDFGYAAMISADGGTLRGLSGTPDYVAPEVLTWYEDDDNGTPYGKGSDLWSLGVLLYVILSGCSPFSADEEEALLAQVSEAKYEFYDSEWKAISAPAKDLISKLLVVDPATRLTMEACLAHPWLAGAIEKGRQKAAEMASAGPSNGPTSAAAKSEVAVEGSPTAEPMSCSNCVLL